MAHLDRGDCARCFMRCRCAEAREQERLVREKESLSASVDEVNALVTARAKTED